MKLLPFGDKFAVIAIIFILLSLSSGFDANAPNPSIDKPPVLWNIYSQDIYGVSIGYDLLLGIYYQNTLQNTPYGVFIYPSLEEVYSLRKNIEKSLEKTIDWAYDEKYFPLIHSLKKEKYLSQLDCNINKTHYAIQQKQCVNIEQSPHHQALKTLFSQKDTSSSINNEIIERRNFSIFIEADSANTWITGLTCKIHDITHNSSHSLILDKLFTIEDSMLLELEEELHKNKIILKRYNPLLSREQVFIVDYQYLENAFFKNLQDCQQALDNKKNNKPIFQSIPWVIYLFQVKPYIESKNDYIGIKPYIKL